MATQPDDGGIAEEYADALAAIGALRKALGPERPTNTTAAGRLLLTLAWLDQEIAAERLPIPVDRSHVSTVYYLTGSGELDAIPGVAPALERLYTVLQGHGVVKERHLPALADMVDRLLAEAGRCPDLDGAERAALDDLRRAATPLRAGQLPPGRRVQDYPFSGVDTPNLDACIPNFFSRYSELENALFERIRPLALRKPPLPAPRPGLPPVAPPLPPELADRLP
jgi:hypothetical protein